MIMEPSDLVLRFVQSIGGPKEAEFYLSLFRAERPESFAIIAVADAIARDAGDALVVDLRFLASLGLTPVIQFGVPDGRELSERRDAREQATWVAERLQPDVRAQVTTPSQARDLARAGVIPLVVTESASPAAAAGGTQSAINERFDELARLASSLATRKIILLGRQSGLQPQEGPVPSLVDLTTEYESLMRILPADEAALLAHARRLLESIPHRMTISVTSPLDLLRELFTVRGAGTLMRRGSEIARLARYAQADIARVRQVIESAFHRRLLPDFLERPIRSLYVADDYRGLAIVQDTPHGPYLSKFAVERRAQGEGVGRDLWRALAGDHETLFWRGRSDNSITGWYQQHCDGMLRTPAWHVFWRGMPIDALPSVIEFAISAPRDFVTDDPGATDSLGP